MKILSGILKKTEPPPLGGRFQQGEFPFANDMVADPALRMHRRLFRYLFAGGMRQTRRTTVDDIVAYRNRRFVFILVFAGLIWCVFYFLVPCT